MEEVFLCMFQATAGPIPYPTEAAEKKECREEYPDNNSQTGQRSFPCADPG